MRIIFGIGNPGKRYKFNRHNVGFMLLDYIAEAYGLSFSPSKFDYYKAEGKIQAFPFILVKPTTYVNNSGIAALQLLEEYSANKKDFLVVYDDLNLETASFRIRARGSSGGHNGIGSLIYHFNSDDFPRLRIGIGAGFEKGRMADYVLTDFNKTEVNSLENTFKESKVLIDEFITGGLEGMLNANSRLKKASNGEE